MQAVEPGIQGVEKPLFIFLHVFVVGQRQSFQRHHHAGQRTLHAAAFATDKLQGVRVFLLRHQRGAGGHAVGKLDEVRLAGVKENQIFRKARQMHHTDSRIGKQLQHMIAIGHAVEAVAGGGGKAQPAGQLLAVDLIRRPRQRAAAQRADVEALQRVLQTAFVTRQHFNVGQTPVREGHRLGALQVGVPRHYRVLILLGGLHQRALQLAVRREQFDNGIFAPQFKIGGDLVVTAAAGMQFLAQLAHFVDQLAFHPAVNIFGIAGEDLLRIGAHLFQQHVQRFFQLLLFSGTQNADRYQRFRPGDRANDILLRQTIVEAQRVVELFKPLICCLCKTPAPKCHNMLPLFVSSAGGIVPLGLRSCKPGRRRAAGHEILSQNTCADRRAVK